MFWFVLISFKAIIGSSEEVTDLREVVFYNNSARNYGGGYYCLLSNCSLAGIYQDNQVRKKSWLWFLCNISSLFIYLFQNLNSLLFRRNMEVELRLINQL